MTWRSDDLTPSLVPPDPEFAGYGQALILEFDRESFDNVILYRGGRLTNLPVLDRVGATTYQAGNVVLLMKWRPTGSGLGSYWIAGSPVVPGAGQAEAAVAFLRGELARQISAEVFAAQIHSAEVVASGATSSASYTDVLTVSGGGPLVPNVAVSSVGIALVGVQAQISIIASPAQTNQAYISYRVTGATTRAAVDSNAKRTDIGDTDAASITNVTDQSMSWSIQTGLNEGLHTFETMYRTSTAFASQAFAQRRIIVIAL